MTKPIGELFKVVNGGTPKTGVAAYWDGEHQWITPAEMGGLPSPYVNRTRRTLTDEGLRVGAAIVPTNSIILSTRAPIGHLVINQTPMAFNQGCKGLIPSSGINTKFAYYFLLANISLLESLGTGTTFKELSGGKLKEVPLSYPPLPEQRRIVAMLDAAFAAIATARAHTEQNLRNARELFESQLAAVFSQRGAGWETSTLEATCEMYQPKTISTKEMVEGGAYPVFGANGEIGRYDKFNHETPQLLVTCRGATCGAINISKPFSWITGNAMVVRPKTATLSMDFLELALRGGIDIATAITGSAQPQITRTNLNPLEINYPNSLDEQNTVVKRLNALRTQSQTLQSLAQRKLAALDELKQSLLQQAFSGQL